MELKSSWQDFHRQRLLMQLQEQSIAMLKSATAAMSIRSHDVAASVTELAGGFLAFNGADTPLTRAVGIGTSGALPLNDIEAIEQFYKQRCAPVRMVISERTHLSVSDILRSRGYESSGFLRNWWLQLNVRRRNASRAANIEIVPTLPAQADLWSRTVAAGFEEADAPVDEATISARTLDTFFCLGFADGAQPFFAKRNGVIAGGGVLHITGKCASIRTTSCRIGHRRQGVQQALLSFRLNEATRAGCSVAFSSTDQMGTSSRNLASFGFQELSTSFTMCLPN